MSPEERIELVGRLPYGASRDNPFQPDEPSVRGLMEWIDGLRRAAVEEAVADERKVIEARASLILNFIPKKEALIAITKAVAAEREACAKVADVTQLEDPDDWHARECLDRCAKAIRGRSAPQRPV